MTEPTPQTDENVSPRTENVYVGSSVADAFHEAMRRWRAQRDSDPNRLSTHEVVEQAFASHGLTIEAEAAVLARPDARPVHVITEEHRRIEAEAVAPALDVDALAQIIREEDGNHDLGAGALAERIVARLAHPDSDGDTR